MIGPKKIKHRKWFRSKIVGIASSGNQLCFGSFGLKALGGGWITDRQIEAARKAFTRFIKKGGKSWIRIFPDHPVTLKGGEVRMGGGKGAVDHYIAVVKPGTIIFEIDGLTEELAREAFRLAAHKLPVQTKLIRKVRGE